MVTDYSGVQFDFAYMRKPILYYHPNELPPHYDESTEYCYERDAFGPIIDNYEELVDQLCDYMKKHCRMKKEYVERADRFFGYKDFGNCERIYHAIVEWLN
jgi:CDP-glycerol glycerophosphotransferase (TagB/SpsB family)